MTAQLPAKVALAGGLIAAWLSLGQVLQVEGLPHGPVSLRGLSVLVTPLGFGASSVMFTAALLRFSLAASARAAAGVLVVLLAAYATLQGWQWPTGIGPNGSVMLPGAALVAWLAGRTVGPAAGADRRGVEAACGIVAASYALAGLSKLTLSGAAWTSPGNIGLHIASHSYDGVWWLQPLRLAVAGNATMCRGMGLGTMVIEFGALAFLFPQLRTVVAAGVCAMHVGIALLMGLHHYDWMLTTVGWAWWSARTPR